MALDVGAELDGLQRAILADQAGDRVQLVGGLEAEGRRIDDAAQLGGFERLRARRDRRHLHRWCRPRVLSCCGRLKNMQ